MNIYNFRNYTILMDDKTIMINGDKYQKPGRGQHLTIVQGQVYINGFEFKDSKFKRTVKALWYHWFK